MQADSSWWNEFAVFVRKDGTKFDQEVIVMTGFSTPGLIKAMNCIPLGNETNCAQCATGRVGDCRHVEVEMFS